MEIGDEAEHRALRPPRVGSTAASFIFIASMPPTALTAYTASTITIPILMTNWNTSVTSTPHSPDRVEIDEVSGDHSDHDRQSL